MGIAWDTYIARPCLRDRREQGGKGKESGKGNWGGEVVCERGRMHCGGRGGKGRRKEMPGVVLAKLCKVLIMVQTFFYTL